MLINFPAQLILQCSCQVQLPEKIKCIHVSLVWVLKFMELLPTFVCSIYTNTCNIHAAYDKSATKHKGYPPNVQLLKMPATINIVEKKMHGRGNLSGMATQMKRTPSTCSCAISNIIWSKVLTWANLQTVIPSTSVSLQKWWQDARKTIAGKKQKKFDSIVMLTSWSLWKERNNRVFEKTSKPVNVIFMEPSEHGPPFLTCTLIFFF